MNRTTTATAKLRRLRRAAWFGQPAGSFGVAATSFVVHVLAKALR